MFSCRRPEDKLFRTETYLSSHAAYIYTERKIKLLITVAALSKV
jgi:hypothetical protein